MDRLGNELSDIFKKKSSPSSDRQRRPSESDQRRSSESEPRSGSAASLHQLDSALSTVFQKKESQPEPKRLFSIGGPDSAFVRYVREDDSIHFGSLRSSPTDTTKKTQDPKHK